jgi:hypothetical protein
MDDIGRRYWTSTVDLMETQNISMLHQVSKCVLLKKVLFLAYVIFNGKNREKNSTKLMMSLVVTHPSM